MKQKGFTSIILILFVLVFAGVAGYLYLGKNLSQISLPTPKSLVTPTPSKTDETANWKSYTSTQLSNNSLKPYSIKYPNSWELKTLRENGMDTLTLTKSGYIITIYQAAFGGVGCIFEGEIPQGPYEDLRDKKYVEIKSGIGTLRRFINTVSKDPSSVQFDFCSQSNDQSFGKPTLYGIISYKVPQTDNQSVLEEMDKILATLNEAK